MLDLVPQLRVHVVDVADALEGRVAERHAEQLLVGALLVGHVEDADRADADPAAGEGRVGDEHERVERVAVVGERALDEAVVRRVRHRREQAPVEHDAAELVVPLVLVAGPRRDLDEDDGVGLLASCADGAGRAPCSRSATRSSADSIPTERRTRFGGAANGAFAVAGVRHPRRHLDQALDAAERLGELEELRARDERRRLLRRLDEEGDHAAEVVHLPRGDRRARDASAGPGRARARRRAGAASQTATASAFSQCCRIRTASVLIPRRTSHAVERARHGAERLLQEVEALRDGRVVRRREAADDVASGRRGTSSSSARRRRRRARAAAAGTASRRCCRRPGARRPRARRRPRRGCRRRSASGSTASRSRPSASSRRGARRGSANSSAGHVLEAVALRLVDLRGHPVDAAVDVGDQDDALARVDEVHQRRRRAEAGRERDPVLGRLERARAQPGAPCASGCSRGRSRSPCARRPRPARRSRSGRSA